MMKKNTAYVLGMILASTAAVSVRAQEAEQQVEEELTEFERQVRAQVSKIQKDEEKARLINEIATLKEKKANLKTQLDTLIHQVNEGKDRIIESLEADLIVAKVESQTKLNSLRQKTDAELQAMRDESARTLAAANAEHDRVVADLNTRAAAAAAAAANEKSQLQQQLQATRDEAERTRLTLLAKIAELEASIEQQRIRFEQQLAEANRNAAQERARLETALAEQAAALRTANAAVQAAQQAAAAAQAQNAQAQAAAAAQVAAAQRAAQQAQANANAQVAAAQAAANAAAAAAAALARCPVNTPLSLAQAAGCVGSSPRWQLVFQARATGSGHNWGSLAAGVYRMDVTDTGRSDSYRDTAVCVLNSPGSVTTPCCNGNDIDFQLGSCRINSDSSTGSGTQFRTPNATWSSIRPNSSYNYFIYRLY
jgi:hypothetical protein